MAKERKSPFWQVCEACDRRVYSAEAETCDCQGDVANKMTPATMHADNNPKPAGGHPPKAKTATVPSSSPAEK